MVLEEPLLARVEGQHTAPSGQVTDTCLRVLFHEILVRSQAPLDRHGTGAEGVTAAVVALSSSLSPPPLRPPPLTVLSTTSYGQTMGHLAQKKPPTRLGPSQDP